MKMKFFLLLTVLSLWMQAGAQLSGFANKIKNKVNNKVNQRVDKKVDKVIDGSLDAAEGKSPGTTTDQPEAINPGATSSGDAVKSYSKFDFVPGELVVYADDFAKDEMGQLPLKWNTQGKAELVTMNMAAGNWLRLFPTAVYLTSNDKTFGKNFTVEFDLVLQMKNTGYSYPYFSFGLLSSADLEPNDNSLLTGYRKNQSAEIYIRLSSGGTTSTYMESYAGGKKTFYTETQGLSALENHYGKLSHIAMQVQESRLRVWVNGEKKFDLPRALPVEQLFNNIFFRTHGSSYKEDQLGFYISNIKVATGIPDTRFKLVEEGKFSTTGILFDVNAATIKAESMGTLKEIALVLKKYPDMKVKIIGHTDNDGSETANLELSKKRAIAVKESLARDFEVETSRLEADGKGEAMPVADNKLKEGKAQNRRVEFIKL